MASANVGSLMYACHLLRDNLINTIESTPPDFDMIYLELCLESCTFKTTPSDKLNDPLCAGAILWNKASALKLVADLKGERNNIEFWFQKGRDSYSLWFVSTNF